MTKEKELNNYRLTCLFSPLQKKTEINRFVEKIKDWLKEKGGAISRSAKISQKKQAYSLKNFQEGIYLDLFVSLRPDLISELEKEIRASQALRWMITKHQLNQKPSLSSRPRPDLADQTQKPKQTEAEPLKNEDQEKKIPEPAKAPASSPKAAIEEIDKKLDEILNE